MTQGRFITSTSRDVTDHTAVAVLGSDTAAELFSRVDPVGQTVNVNGVPMTVIGVPCASKLGGLLVVLNRIRPGRPGHRAHDHRLTARLFGSTALESSILIQSTSSSTLSAAYQEANDQARLALHWDPQPPDAGNCRHAAEAVAGDNGHLCRSHPDHPAPRRHRRHLVTSVEIGRDEHHVVSVTEQIREIKLPKATRSHAAADQWSVPPRGFVLGLAGGYVGAKLAWSALPFLPHVIGYLIAIPAITPASEPWWWPSPSAWCSASTRRLGRPAHLSTPHGE